MDRVKEIKKRIDAINKEQRRLDKLIEKQEEDGIYSDKLYNSINELEDEKNNLSLELEALENKVHGFTKQLRALHCI